MKEHDETVKKMELDKSYGSQAAERSKRRVFPVAQSKHSKQTGKE
jgi:hypothetical protein